MNILKTQDSNYFFSSVNNDLKLIYEEVDVNNPNDSSYAYGGYCPICVRLIEKAFSNGWDSIKETLKKLPGETDFPINESEIINNEKNERKYFLAVFIGGITYGELAAIRYLNKINKNKKIIVLTTSMINTNKIFKALSFKN